MLFVPVYNKQAEVNPAMNRVCALALLAFSFAVQPLRAANPDDLKFELRLVGDRNAFHPGEAIPLEFTYSTESQNKYQGSFPSPSPELADLNVEVTPLQSVVDLRSVRYGLVAGSFLSAVGFLTAMPRTERMDLTDWYQFRKSGHYSVRVQSSSIARVKTADEDGERLTLESNAVEFDILPADAAWATEEKSKFDDVLRTQPSVSQAWRDALTRLARLGTPASAERLVQIYAAGSAEQSGWELNRAMRETPQSDVVISALLATLSDSSMSPPSNIANLLADLQTQQKLGASPPQPVGDPVGFAEWNAQMAERQKTRQVYFQQANDLLLTTVEKRTGANRAAAIFQVWWNREGGMRTSGVSQETLEQLRNSVLSVQDELPSKLQQQLAVTGWRMFPHARLLPLVRKFAKESLDAAFSAGGYEYVTQWCGEEPEACDQAILEAAQKPGPNPYKPAVLLLVESPHPELDEWLREELRNPEIVQGSAKSETLAALILRVGSENLMPDVIQLLDKLSGNGSNCDLRADLLGYVFRFNTKQAAKRLSAALQSGEDKCAGQLLRPLNGDRYSDDLIAPSLAALHSPNLSAVGIAALFLAAHGPGGTEETLIKRLDALHEIWQEQASELNDIQPFLTETPQRQAAVVEQQLASALTHAKNWQLSPSEIEHVRSTCLTDQCRSIADGKMSLGF